MAAANATEFKEGQIVDVNDDGMWVKATIVTYDPERSKYVVTFAKGEEVGYFRLKSIREHVPPSEKSAAKKQAAKPAFDQPKKSAGEKQMDKETRALKLKERGNNFFKKGKVDLAINMYTKAINLCPTSAVFYNNRAMAYLKDNQWSLAEQDCTACISLDGKQVKAWFRRGVARMNQSSNMQMLDKAEADFKQVLKLQKNNAPAKQHLERCGILRVKLKEFLEQQRKGKAGNNNDVDDID